MVLPFPSTSTSGPATGSKRASAAIAQLIEAKRQKAGQKGSPTVSSVTGSNQKAVDNTTQPEVEDVATSPGDLPLLENVPASEPIEALAQMETAIGKVATHSRYTSSVPSTTAPGPSTNESSTSAPLPPSSGNDNTFSDLTKVPSDQATITTPLDAITRLLGNSSLDQLFEACSLIFTSVPGRLSATRKELEEWERRAKLDTEELTRREEAIALEQTRQEQEREELERNRRQLEAREKDNALKEEKWATWQSGIKARERGLDEREEKMRQLEEEHALNVEKLAQETSKSQQLQKEVSSRPTLIVIRTNH